LLTDEGLQMGHYGAHGRPHRNCHTSISSGGCGGLARALCPLHRRRWRRRAALRAEVKNLRLKPYITMNLQRFFSFGKSAENIFFYQYFFVIRAFRVFVYGGGFVPWPDLTGSTRPDRANGHFLTLFSHFKKLQCYRSPPRLTSKYYVRMQ